MPLIMIAIGAAGMIVRGDGILVLGGDDTFS